MSTPDFSRIREAYAAAAIAHREATESGDSRKANRNSDRIAAAYRGLREMGPEAQSQLLPLLDHSDSGVRAWAGAHALEFAPEPGARALSSLAKQGDITGFGAEMTLREWKAGRLRFP